MRILLSIVLIAAGACAARAAEPDVVACMNAAAVPRVVHVGAFSYAPNPVTGSASWTAEYLTLETLAGGAERPGNFRADDNLPKFLRASDADYSRNTLGLVRGHLAAAANHGQVDRIYPTFNLSNVVPQDASLNSGLWKTLETRIRDRVSRSISIYVVTIPLARYRENKPRTIGGRYIFVPTELGKTILVIRADEPVEMRAWIVPNGPTDEIDPDAFSCSIAELEEGSQLDLFSFLPDDVEARLEASTTRLSRASP